MTPTLPVPNLCMLNNTTRIMIETTTTAAVIKINQITGQIQMQLLVHTTKKTKNSSKKLVLSGSLVGSRRITVSDQSIPSASCKACCPQEINGPPNELQFDINTLGMYDH